MSREMMSGYRPCDINKNGSGSKASAATAARTPSRELPVTCRTYVYKAAGKAMAPAIPDRVPAGGPKDANLPQFAGVTASGATASTSSRSTSSPVLLNAPNLHARVGLAVPNLRHVEYFHDHQRIEGMLFDGALDPSGGLLTPDPDPPGHGLTLREQDAERYRRA